MRPLLVLGGFAALLALGGCAATSAITSTMSNPVVRPAADAPEAFVTTDQAAPAPGICPSPLVDPRSGDQLTLVRSAGGRGDYEVPAAGRYGVGANELLRADCATGRPAGVVRR